MVNTEKEHQQQQPTCASRTYKEESHVRIRCRRRHRPAGWSKTMREDVDGATDEADKEETPVEEVAATLGKVVVAHDGHRTRTLRPYSHLLTRGAAT